MKSLYDIRDTLNDYENNKEMPQKPEGYGIEGYVYDEYASAKQNREWRIQAEERYKKQRKEYLNESHRLRLKFENDIYEAIQYEYKFNKNQAELLLNYVADDKHTYGILEVMDELIELCDLIQRFLGK